MREIKFRGKESLSREFIYGDLVTSPNGLQYYIIQKERENKMFLKNSKPIWVLPETVGQFTGLKDKHGKKIFEGDTVTMHQFLFDGEEVECETKGVVGYSGSCFTYGKIDSEFIEKYTSYEKGEGQFPLHDFSPIENHFGLHEESFEVVGNKFENPELLKSA